MTIPSAKLLIITALPAFLTGVLILPTKAAEPADVKQHADQSFDRLSQQPLSKGNGVSSTGLPVAEGEGTGGYASDKYWIGKGQGDLAKGSIVCQRVSELSARTDLAKQIRVMVKEHMVDRVRDRSGREPEQDIELTREEIVQEYLQDVKIVDRRIDEDKNICHATAVMPKTQIPQRSAPAPESPPIPTR